MRINCIQPFIGKCSFTVSNTYRNIEKLGMPAFDTVSFSSSKKSSNQSKAKRMDYFTFSQYVDQTKLNSKELNLPNLKTVAAVYEDEDLCLNGFDEVDLSSLKKINFPVIIKNCKNVKLGSLESVNNDISIINSENVDLGSLKHLNGRLHISGNKNLNIGKLESISGDIALEEEKEQEYESIKSIKGSLIVTDSEQISFPNLRTVKENLIVKYSNGTELNSLEEIGGNADFRYSSNVSVPNLTTVNGDIDFSYSKMGNLSKLTDIGGYINTEGATFEYFRHNGANYIGDMEYLDDSTLDEFESSTAFESKPFDANKYINIHGYNN